MNIVFGVLRFVGAIVAAVLFSYLLDIFHILFFGGVVHFFANLSWSNWISFDIFRGFLLPIVWTILWIIGVGLAWLVRGSKWIAALPIIYFLLRIVNDIVILFVEPIEPIVDEIGLGFWYYAGAVVTFIEILVFYIICTLQMLSKELW